MTAANSFLKGLVGAAVIELLERHGVALEGRRVAVLGRSNWVRPSGRSLGRRARILRASARAVDTHRDSITSRFDCSPRQ